MSFHPAMRFHRPAPTMSRISSFKSVSRVRQIASRAQHTPVAAEIFLRRELELGTLTHGGLAPRPRFQTRPAWGPSRSFPCLTNYTILRARPRACPSVGHACSEREELGE